MEPTEDYKSRSGAVRSTARSHLALIRQNRIARRADRPADPAGAEPTPAAEPPVPAPEAASPTAIPPAPAAASADLSSEPAPTPPGALRQPVVPADSDLFALPGAGSGLVWMLRTCGIDTLQDLAAADPDRLSAELGLIGQILDIRDWIAFARAQVASR